VTDCDPLPWVLGISRGVVKKILMGGAAIAVRPYAPGWSGRGCRSRLGGAYSVNVPEGEAWKTTP
jgi:hypothetical protein